MLTSLQTKIQENKIELKFIQQTFHAAILSSQKPPDKKHGNILFTGRL